MAQYSPITPDTTINAQIIYYKPMAWIIYLLAALLVGGADIGQHYDDHNHEIDVHQPQLVEHAC